MSEQDGGALLAAHKAAHQRHGTTIEIVIPSHVPYDYKEALMDAVADLAMGDFNDSVPIPPRGSFDVIVASHSSSSCGWPDHPRDDSDKCACGDDLKACDGCGATICPGCDDEALCVRENTAQPVSDTERNPER